jgi:hypothetical protein
MEVVVMPDRQGQTMISLMDFIPGSVSKQVTIRKDHIICTALADPRILSLYEKAINPPSPVAQPAEKKLLLPAGA